MEKKGKGINKLTVQVSIFFFVGLLITDILSFFVIRAISEKNVMKEKKNITQGVSIDVEKSLKEYISYEWVLNYLLEHEDDDNLNLEYDSTTRTMVKTSELLRAHPGLDLKIVTAGQLSAFPENEKKLYAEIVYNDWINRINDLKAAFDVEYLYIVASDDDYLVDNFLLSGADETMIRGQEFGNAYTFGTKVKKTKEQTEAFKKLALKGDIFVYSHGYVDSYKYLLKLGDTNIIVGMTFEIAGIRKTIIKQTIQFIIAFFLLQIVLFVIYRIQIFRSAVKPLKDVESYVREYANTKDGKLARVKLGKIDQKNELGSLADGIISMTREIDEHLSMIKKVTADKERFSAELDLARKIQIDMMPNKFPPFPDKKEFDIYASMDPAKEVGGDFYDFFMVDEDHLTLVIADVSGKGIPAALFMANAKTLIKIHSLQGGTPSEILRDVSEALLEGNEEGMFVTVWMAVVDIHTGKGVAINAGHEHPVIRHKDGSYELVKYRHYMALAMMSGLQYKEHEFQLEPGDRVFVYTDGLPETRNASHEFFGTDRMLEALNRNRDEEGDKLLKNVRKEVDVFANGEEQFDDITMLVFDYYGRV
ncbi:MAG: PP2C family protein-serine/threonine phosphatase [Eubacterium sp.]|nr:PP2C family protein-serine/threonine phosphatase [Eubacterium sp.]